MSFAKHVLYWIILLVLAAFLVPALSSSTNIMARVVSEVRMMQSVLGTKETVQITSVATKIYNEVFVETDVIPTAQKAIVSEQERKSSRDMFGKTIDKLTDGTNDYVIGVAALTYAVLVRILIFLVWLPYIAPFFVAVIMDGLVRRKIKMASFGLISPIYYAAATHSLIVMIFLPALYLLVPFPITPLFIPFWALFAAVPLMLAVSNTQQVGH